MMINNLKQLNDFVEKSGVKSENHIIPKLIESGEIVSAEIAKLLKQPYGDSKRFYS